MADLNFSVPSGDATGSVPEHTHTIAEVSGLAEELTKLENDSAEAKRLATESNDAIKNLGIYAQLTGAAFTGPISVTGAATGLFEVHCTAATGYSRAQFTGDAIAFSVGVGNSAAPITSIRNCWYVYDSTNAAVRMSIDGSGEVVIPGSLSVRGTTITPATQPTVSQKSALDAAISPGASNPFGTINDVLRMTPSPLTENASYPHATYGSVFYLDTTNQLTVWGYEGVAWKGVRLCVVTADASVTGNIVLVCGSNTKAVAVSTTATWIDWTFDTPVSGRIVIGRNPAAAADTLKDGSNNVVTALLLDWRKR